MIITNGNLDVVDDGIEFVIKRDKSILDKYALFHSHALLVQFTSTSMDEWCIEQHGKVNIVCDYHETHESLKCTSQV